MSIRRQKRIDLNKYDSTWENTYLLFLTKSSYEISDYTKKIKAVQKEMEEHPEDDATAMKMLDLMVTFLQESFIGGKVYDYDLKAIRDATKEDIKDFDMQIMGDLFKSLIGELSKN